MKLTHLRASSNISWLEATQQLISTAIQNGNIRRLSILEDISEQEGKYRLKAHVRNR